VAVPSGVIDRATFPEPPATTNERIASIVGDYGKEKPHERRQRQRRKDVDFEKEKVLTSTTSAAAVEFHDCSINETSQFSRRLLHVHTSRLQVKTINFCRSRNLFIHLTEDR
jgi:hypothetical protein